MSIGNRYFCSWQLSLLKICSSFLVVLSFNLGANSVALKVCKLTYSNITKSIRRDGSYLAEHIWVGLQLHKKMLLNTMIALAKGPSDRFSFIMFGTMSAVDFVIYIYIYCIQNVESLKKQF